jgi:hypothetical protein
MIPAGSSGGQDRRFPDGHLSGVSLIGVSLVTRLKQLMDCPVDWSKEFPDDEAWFSSLPYLDWYYCLSLHSVDADDLPYEPYEFEELSDHPEELRRMIINLEERRPRSVELYMKRAGRLKGLRFMTPADQRKHFVGNADPEELKRRSRNGPSLFFTSYSSHHLEKTFWYWFQMYLGLPLSQIDNPPHLYYDFIEGRSEESNTPEARLWRRFLSDPHLRIVIDTMDPVGASKGEMTTLICYDLHLDSKIVHCYPVAPPDAARIMEGGNALVDDSFHEQA